MPIPISHDAEIAHHQRRLARSEGTTKFRWVPGNKLAVIRLIELGVTTEEAAIEKYGITSEELAGWKQRNASHGKQGLRSTRLQNYRSASQSPALARA